jgi:hypothetical protein
MVLLDAVVEAAQRDIFNVKMSAYKTGSNGYIIWSVEKPSMKTANSEPLR